MAKLVGFSTLVAVSLAATDGRVLIPLEYFLTMLLVKLVRLANIGCW